MTNLFLIWMLSARGQISKLLYILVTVIDHYHSPYYHFYYYVVIMITKPAYRRLCTLTFSKSVFVGFRYSPRSDVKRLTSRDSVANSSFARSLARSSQLENNRLVCKYVVRTEPMHIKNSM